MEIPSSSFNSFYSMNLFKAHSHMAFFPIILTHMLLICHDFRISTYIESSSSFTYVCLRLDRSCYDKKLYYNVCEIVVVILTTCCGHMSTHYAK